MARCCGPPSVYQWGLHSQVQGPPQLAETPVVSKLEGWKKAAHSQRHPLRWSRKRVLKLGFVHMAEPEAFVASKGSHGTMRTEASAAAGSRPAAVHAPSESPSDEGFRAAVQELSKPLGAKTNGAPSTSSPGGARSSSPDSTSPHQSEEDATVSSQTFTGDKAQPRTVRPDIFLDGSNETRRQSSQGASSSAPRAPPDRWERGVVRQRRTVVDRWVSSDDEEDYLSRRPARYEKWDRSLASEYSSADRSDTGGRDRGWKRGAPRRVPVAEAVEGTDSATEEGQVATLQRRVPTELLAIVRKRRALERTQRKEAVGGTSSDSLKQVSKPVDKLEKADKAPTGGLTEIHLEAGASERGEGGVEGVGQKKPQWGRQWRKAQESSLQRSLTLRVIRLARRKQLDKVGYSRSLSISSLYCHLWVTFRCSGQEPACSFCISVSARQVVAQSALVACIYGRWFKRPA